MFKKLHFKTKTRFKLTIYPISDSRVINISLLILIYFKAQVDSLINE